MSEFTGNFLLFKICLILLLSLNGYAISFSNFIALIYFFKAFYAFDYGRGGSSRSVLKFLNLDYDEMR